MINSLLVVGYFNKKVSIIVALSRYCEKFSKCSLAALVHGMMMTGPASVGHLPPRLADPPLPGGGGVGGRGAQAAQAPG